jgi:hypothetical protein
LVHRAALVIDRGGRGERDMQPDECKPAAVDREIPPSGSNEADPLRRLLQELVAIREFASHLVVAQVDSLRLRVAKLALIAGLSVAAVLLGGILAVICLLYIVRGVAGGLAAALGDRPWLGELLAGIGGIALLAALVFLAIGWTGARRRRAQQERFEKRKAQQRARVGFDVEEAACGVG